VEDLLRERAGLQDKGEFQLSLKSEISPILPRKIISAKTSGSLFAILLVLFMSDPSVKVLAPLKNSFRSSY